MEKIVLSHFQTRQIRAAQKARQDTVNLSLDLGLTTQETPLESNGIHLPNGRFLTSSELELIDRSERNCFTIEPDGPQKIQIFSETDHKLYSLMPTQGAPTLLVSGISMHRIKGIDPRGDAMSKVKTLTPVAGQVLDTATGLGYTAITASKSADHVITIELSPTSLEIARLNPWSRPLFNNPKITLITGDSCQEIALFDTGQFTRIIHDPPSFSLAGELYSGEFYRELFRIMQRRGRLYHYIGDLASQSGRNNAIAKGVMRRLSEVGFSRIARCAQAFGLVAYK